MFSKEVFNDSQVKAYLNRIGLNSCLDNSLETLNKLLFAHLTHIPFDSIDVWGAGICPSLELQDIYEKIVINRRGGYCFEQNTLFRIMLCSLGFDAYQVAACILSPDGSAQPPAHNVVICNLDGRKLLLDVGFGGPVPYEALELVPGKYGIFDLEKNGEYYRLTRQEGDTVRPFILFRDVPVTISDLIPMNFYISQKPDSHFRHILHINQRNPDGSTYVVNGNELKIHKDGQTVVQTIGSIEELKEVLMNYYQMDPATCMLRDII